ncbi:MAG: hypothetical protein Ct9H300mP6_12660 [Gammaproteobacteria bacterium]|nr:MAG: hypothetical protein Ct9H300mP6_12660 [Gammaproteobacteria bacterium]
MKKRIRQGAKIIVVDPRKTDIVKSPHVKADFHLPILPGSNVPDKCIFTVAVHEDLMIMNILKTDVMRVRLRLD